MPILVLLSHVQLAQYQMLKFKFFAVVAFVTPIFVHAAPASICPQLTVSVLQVFDAVTADDNTRAVELHGTVKQIITSTTQLDQYTTMLGQAQERYGKIPLSELASELQTVCAAAEK